MIIKKNIQQRLGHNKFKCISHLILLHEIKHAIDYCCGNLKFEWGKTNRCLYYTFARYHNSQPFEKRADEFARQELKHWRKNA